MSAFIRVSMVSGTLSWSLSSMAVAPSSCRFCTPTWVKADGRKKKPVSGDQSCSGEAFRTSSVRKTCAPGLCHSAGRDFPSSAALVYHVQKPQRAFFLLWMRHVWGVNAPVHVHAHLQTPTSPAQARLHNTLSVFPPGKLGEVRWALIWAKTGSNIWQAPGVEGSWEPAAEKKQGPTLDIVTLGLLWFCLNICRRSARNHTW